MVNVLYGLNSLNLKVDDEDVDKLKIVLVDWKKLSGVVWKEVARNTKFNKLNTKLNNLENKIPDASILIQRNQ